MCALSREQLNRKREKSIRTLNFSFSSFKRSNSCLSRDLFESSPVSYNEKKTLLGSSEKSTMSGLENCD